MSVTLTPGSLAVASAAHHRPAYAPWILLAILAPLALILPSFALYIATLVVAYGMAALGLDLVLGRLGLLSFGHSAFIAVGAYGSTILTSDVGVPFPVAVLVAVLLGALLGALVAFPALRLSDFSFALVTFGTAFIVTALLNGSWLRNWTGGEGGRTVLHGSLFGLDLGNTTIMFLVAIAALAVVVMVVENMVRSRTGWALGAIKRSEAIGATLGISANRVRIAVFSLSAGIASLSGVILGQAIGYLSPATFDLTLSVTLVVMVVIGGLRTTMGPLIGASFFVLLPEFLQGAREQAELIFAAALILTLIVMPSGVAGVAGRLRGKLRAGIRSGQAAVSDVGGEQ